LRAEAVDVVVVAVDGHQRRRVDSRTDDLAALEVAGDEYVGVEARARGMRGDTVGEVAGRRGGERRKPELLRLRRGDGDDAVLERPGGVRAVVLDVEILQPELL